MRGVGKGRLTAIKTGRHEDFTLNTKNSMHDHGGLDDVVNKTDEQINGLECNEQL